MGMEPGTTWFQIRQSLFLITIKASSYSKAVYMKVLLVPNPATLTPSICDILPLITYCHNV
ncbi:hypothetical protein DPMN_095972 [Dreissena polymorpha]|uniref:Uncharacterized protein n=1 Tax=Dreissena polymorpha TaxID=45954 RepID=A0A9D4L7V9_DREPO|nr:hypothetical protein DPMN_095972 [Dreissena polymorpha]